MADEMESSLARGGQLYDKWYKVIGVKSPGEKAPAYPDSGKYASKPSSTWRCKECHGWDYKGKDGAYSKGKHFTGIKGIQGMMGASTADIIAVLKDDKHQLDKAKGAAYFNTICVGCHRKDGTRPKDMDKTLGKQMGNPWEVMHKIMNGQPDEPMPALRALDMQIVLDIMAHVKTLPTTK
jgi:thiosulfate dehydrogenase